MMPLLVLGVAAAMIVIERVAPGRRWPRVAGWWPRALALNAFQFVIAYVAAVTWDPWMQGLRWWSLDVHPWVDVVGGYLAITFVYYWWHRLRHEIPFLWNWFHQVHHSPTRIEVITSFYKHPLEILVNGVLSSAILSIGLGLSPAETANAVLLTGLAELFYHWNVRTPHWLGYGFQRPESHCVHHQRGLHSYNYADLPLWDMLFGTFCNPRRWEADCGFSDECERKLGEMLCGQNVTEETA